MVTFGTKQLFVERLPCDYNLVMGSERCEQEPDRD